MAEGWIYSLTFQNRTFELAEGEHIAGRSRACDISIPDPSVSRKHVRLRPGPGHVLIQDLNSSNGTYVNDRRVHGEDAVEDGDVLRLGDAEIRVTIESPEEASTLETVRLPTAGRAAAPPAGGEPQPAAPEPAAPEPAASQPAAPPPPPGGERKVPGPATTMLQEESVRLADQAERDRQQTEAEAEKVAQQPEPSAPPESSAEEPSPLATQRLQIPPSGEAPSDAPPPPARGTEPPTRPAPEPEETAPPTAPSGGRQAPWAEARPGEVQPKDEASPAGAGTAPAAEEDPSLRTQRIQIPEGGPSQPGTTQPGTTQPGTTQPGTTQQTPQQQSPTQPGATQRIPTQQSPSQQSPSQQSPSRESPQAPPAQPPGASTVRMSAEELRAAGVERSAEPAQVTEFDLDEPSSSGSSEVKPPDDFVPLSDRLARGEEVESSAGVEPAAAAQSPPPPAVPSPAEAAAGPATEGELSFDQPVKSWAETPPGDGREASFADLDLDSSVGVEPPDADVWEPPEISGSKTTFESTWVPTDEEGESGPSPPTPSPSVGATESAKPPPVPGSEAAPSPPSRGAGEGPSEAQPPASPPPEPSASAALSPAEGAAPPAPGQEPAAPSPPSPPAVPTSFDQPTPAAAPPSQTTEKPAEEPASGFSPPPPAEASSSFDRPTTPAAPPPARKELAPEERAGSAGILPTLDEIEGGMAGPEMDLPYEPDPDPTAQVPTIGHRSIDESAGFLLRTLATVLDGLWISALTIAVWMVSDQNQLASFVVVTLCGLGNLAGWALWGTTPGKKALGLRVEDRRGEAGIGFLRALIRAAGYVVSGLTLGIGFLMVAFRSDRRALHDRIAGTWVRRHG